jgi:hypothetical protein
MATRMARGRGSARGSPRAHPGGRTAGSGRAHRGHEFLKAMRQSGDTLQDAVAELKADRELDLEAAGQTVHAGRYVGAVRKVDRELFLATVPQVKCASQHAAAELRRTASSSGGPCGRRYRHGRRSWQGARRAASSSWQPCLRMNAHRNMQQQSSGGPRARQAGRAADGTDMEGGRGRAQGGPRARPGNRASG